MFDPGKARKIDDRLPVQTGTDRAAIVGAMGPTAVAALKNEHLGAPLAIDHPHEHPFVPECYHEGHHTDAG